mgnify:CR=1 FL=1
MKYHRLTDSQFIEMHHEFAIFLASNSIDKTKWDRIKETELHTVDLLLDGFSDLVWEKILTQCSNFEFATKDQLFLRMKDEDWDDVINTNLSSVFNITKAFIKSMVKQREGRVINISSVAGLMGNPGQVNYSSSKAAIGGFTKSLAKELASRNITVNSIAPGFISSDMTDALTDDQKSEILNQIPMQKFGDPKNIAELAVFLASEKGQYITGQTISVDGGLYMI